MLATIVWLDVDRSYHCRLIYVCRDDEFLVGDLVVQLNFGGMVAAGIVEEDQVADVGAIGLVIHTEAAESALVHPSEQDAAAAMSNDTHSCRQSVTVRWVHTHATYKYHNPWKHFKLFRKRRFTRERFSSQDPRVNNLMNDGSFGNPVEISSDTCCIFAPMFCHEIIVSVCPIDRPQTSTSSVQAAVMTPLSCLCIPVISPAKAAIAPQFAQVFEQELNRYRCECAQMDECARKADDVTTSDNLAAYRIDSSLMSVVEKTIKSRYSVICITV
jgi:hypothetical protein